MHVGRSRLPTARQVTTGPSQGEKVIRRGQRETS